jgi:hypothetical protein
MKMVSTFLVLVLLKLAHSTPIQENINITTHSNESTIERDDLSEGSSNNQTVQLLKHDNLNVLDICDPNPCYNNGACVKSGPNYAVCVCLPGFIGFTCQYRNACARTPCLNGASCTPTGDNTYHCSCPSNYYGDCCQFYVEAKCTEMSCLNGGKCYTQEYNPNVKCTCPPLYYGK